MVNIAPCSVVQKNGKITRNRDVEQKVTCLRHAVSQPLRLSPLDSPPAFIHLSAPFEKYISSSFLLIPSFLFSILLLRPSFPLSSS